MQIKTPKESLHQIRETKDLNQNREEIGNNLQYQKARFHIEFGLYLNRIPDSEEILLMESVVTEQVTLLRHLLQELCSCFQLVF